MRRIGFAAIGFRSEVGRVGFQENPVCGCRLDDLTDVIGAIEGGDAVESEIKTFLKTKRCQWQRRTEAVYHTLAAQVSAVVAQNVTSIVVRLPRVNDDWQVVLHRQLQLTLENLALNTSIGVVVVIIQTNFANGDHALRSETRPDRVL